MSLVVPTYSEPGSAPRPPASLERAADGGLIVVQFVQRERRRGDGESHWETVRLVGRVASVCLACAVPCTAGYVAGEKPYDLRPTALDLARCDPAAVLAELAARRLPLLHHHAHPSGELCAECVDGKDSGRGWRLFGCDNVLILRVFYDTPRATPVVLAAARDPQQPPVWLECAEDGGRLVAMQGPSTPTAAALRLGTVYGIRLGCAVPWRGDLPVRRYGWRSVELAGFDPRGVLAELIERGVPLAHNANLRFARGSLDATCLDGLDSGIGWSLFGCENVLQLELFYGA